MYGQRNPGFANGPSTPPAGLQPSTGQPPIGDVWVAVEHSRVSGSAKADGTGLAIAELRLPGDRGYKVQRISVSSDSATTTTAAVYLDTPDPKNLVDISYNGNGDVADEINPIAVPAGTLILVVWSGASVNANCSVNMQYEAGRYQRGPVIGAG